MPPVDESHQIVLSAIEALRGYQRTAASTCSTTAESLSQARLAGHPTAGYVDHRRVPIKSMLASCQPPPRIRTRTQPARRS
jgi:hypothetical protein